MQTRSDAEEHLRIIRSLMEKATIYRAISAEAAAVGGVLAISASFAFGNWIGKSRSGFAPVEPWKFFVLWLAVLTVAGSVNACLLYRGARRRGEQFASTGMRMAVKALLPSFIVAGFFTVGLMAFASQSPAASWCFAWIVPIWITCYGVALLATSHFAPRSLWWLGWAFLLAGMAAFPQVLAPFYEVYSGSGTVDPSRAHDAAELLFAQRWMAGTFGLFHLIYAACAWPRKSQQSSGGAPV